MVLNQKEYNRQYRKTPKGKRIYHIKNWKSRGIIHNQGLKYLYDNIYLPTTHCNKCNIEFFSDGYRTKKCADHNHSIIGEHNFRAVICHSCNLNDRMDNTSGVPNISYYKSSKLWRYNKIYNKIAHIKYFKSYYEAVIYKWLYESNIPIN